MLRSFQPGQPEAIRNGVLGGKSRAAALSPGERALIAVLGGRARWKLEPWTEAQCAEFKRGFELGYAHASGWNRRKLKQQK